MVKLIKLLLVVLCIWIINGCVKTTTSIPPVEFEVSPVATPSTFDEALIYMKSQSADERILGMWAILAYPSKNQTVLPLIVQNLYYQQNSDVRSAAARVLGELGPRANIAIPDLINVMQTDSYSDVQVDIAITLGKIDEPSAVPALAGNLFNYKDKNIAAFSAKSISQLVGEPFPDSDSSGFRLNAQDVPFIVVAAQEWWLNEGQFEDWNKK